MWPVTHHAVRVLVLSLGAAAVSCGGVHTTRDEGHRDANWEEPADAGPGGDESIPDAAVAPDAQPDARCETDCYPADFDELPPCNPDCLDHECGLDPVCWNISCGECEEPAEYCSVDGQCVSNPCPEEMLPIVDSNVCIDRYEASQGEHGEALSVPRVLPLVEVTWYEARLACDLASKRLCTAVEWAAACSGPERWAFPYGEVYQPTRCNGYHAGTVALAPTGHMDFCEGGLPGLFDTSGNVMEWVADCASGEVCSIRGGSYSASGMDLGCFDARSGGSIGPHDARSDVDLGFRCCVDL